MLSSCSVANVNRWWSISAALVRRVVRKDRALLEVGNPLLQVPKCLLVVAGVPQSGKGVVARSRGAIFRGRSWVARAGWSCVTWKHPKGWEDCIDGNQGQDSDADAGQQVDGDLRVGEHGATDVVEGPHDNVVLDGVTNRVQEDGVLKRGSWSKFQTKAEYKHSRGEE